MNNPFNTRAPAFDADAIQQTIARALASAGLDTRTGPMHTVTETIRRALNAGQAAPPAPGVGSGPVIDVAARVVPDAGTPPQPAEPVPPAGETAVPGGQVESHAFRNAAGRRAYRVFVPAGLPESPAVAVMLHGCTQGADDFAAGTQMNRLAQAHGFLVVYPEQARQANAQKCWNWFQPTDQVRDSGEPSLVAGLVNEVVRRHGADPRRVCVAGLSAGAAMAVVLGETYPELFAAVGVHSGLPYRSAHDIPSALAAMKGGRSGRPGLKVQPSAAGASPSRVRQAVPLIVFHGDRDHTVHASNGTQVVQQALEAHAGLASQVQGTGHGLAVHQEAGVAPGGRRYSRTVYTDRSGRPWVESWTVHGAGHAWSGGHASGSFTDGTGPDASAEMVRFFLAQPRVGTA